MYHKMKMLKAKIMKFIRWKSTKKSLLSFDDKRYICNNRIESFT